MSMPRICAAAASASAGLCTTFTPPALPRPPVLTCALTTTVPPPRLSAAARASVGVEATMPASTGTPCFSNMSRAWYSKRSIGILDASGPAVDEALGDDGPSLIARLGGEITASQPAYSTKNTRNTRNIVTGRRGRDSFAGELTHEDLVQAPSQPLDC